MAGEPPLACRESRASRRLLVAHVLVLLAGTVLVLANVFQTTIWFDESYTLALVERPAAEIVRIGSTDVHPVLYYLALHVLYLVFGSNVIVFRLFSAAGIVALALLGLTHVRRDFGPRAGLAFSFLVLATPCLAGAAAQMRMYSWVIFTVAACFLYAVRIAGVASGRGVGASAAGTPSAIDGADDAAGGNRDAGRIPALWWLAFFVTSLASAYLHYYGTLAAFVINVLLLVHLCRARHPQRARLVATLLVGAAVQVGAYVPWLGVLLGQISSISGGWWVGFTFPYTLVKLLFHPFITDPVYAALAGRGEAVPAVRILAWVLVVALVAVAVVLVVHGVRAAVRKRGEGSRLSGMGVLVVRDAIIVYLAVIAIAGVAGLIMGSLIIHYRYLAVMLGPLLLAAALGLARVRPRGLLVATCSVLAVFAVFAQVLAVQASTAPANDEPVAYYREAVQGEDGNGAAVPDVDRDAGRDAGGAADADVASLATLPVLGRNIGIMGTLAVLCPDIPQTYIDWQSGYWGAPYEAYEPTITCEADASSTLDGYVGRFVYVEDGSSPDAGGLNDLLWREDGRVSLIEKRTFWRPYDQTNYTIAVLEKTDAAGLVEWPNEEAARLYGGEEASGDAGGMEEGALESGGADGGASEEASGGGGGAA